MAGETRAVLGGAGGRSAPACWAPGCPFSTTKDALVWIGAARRLTYGKTR